MKRSSSYVKFFMNLEGYNYLNLVFYIPEVFSKIILLNVLIK